MTGKLNFLFVGGGDVRRSGGKGGSSDPFPDIAFQNLKGSLKNFTA